MFVKGLFFHSAKHLSGDLNSSALQGISLFRKHNAILGWAFL